MECEDIFVNYVTKKGLVAKTYKQFIQLNIKKKFLMGRRSTNK